MDAAMTSVIAPGSLRSADASPLTAPAATVRPAQQEPSAAEEARARESARAEAVQKLVEQLKEHLSPAKISIAFTPYGAKNERVAIKVLDKESGKVIREIPPEEIQSLYAKMSDLAGMLIDAKV
jgi:flagellar protein FlaG